jgi:hypothetical protein
LATLKSKYFWFLILLVVGYGLFEHYRPRPIDWTSTYSNKDKIPFGTQALYELLPDVFPKQKITSVRLPIYNQLKENKLPALSNYVFVNQNFEIDGNDRSALLGYVSKGNTAFISAYDFPDTLLNLLGVSAKVAAPKLRDTTMVINWVNPKIKQVGGYVFSHDDGRNYLKIKTNKNVVVLAKNTRNEPVFVKINYGKGTFFIHNLPLSLTNYYVLGAKTTNFAFDALSYLPVAPTYWDEYQKQGRFGEDEQSVLRFIMTKPPLRWAYYLALLGLVLFAVFAGKRTQRIIPVVEPPKNTSLEFVQTIGLMYFQQGNHANIAQKKIQYLLSFIREKYGLKTTILNEDFCESLSKKTGIDRKQIDELVSKINQTEQGGRLQEYALLDLNRDIEGFYDGLK